MARLLRFHDLAKSTDDARIVPGVPRCANDSLERQATRESPSERAARLGASVGSQATEFVRCVVASTDECPRDRQGRIPASEQEGQQSDRIAHV